MPDVDPDQLLKELEAKLAMIRARRPGASRNNPATRIWVMVAFCVVLVLVLWGMQAFLSQMIPRRNAPAPAPAQAHR